MIRLKKQQQPFVQGLFFVLLMFLVSSLWTRRGGGGSAFVVSQRRWWTPTPRQQLVRSSSPSSSSSRQFLFSTTTVEDRINTIYDVIVVGGGHAGCEAATAAARTGAQTLLVTQRLDTIGELSCNPSIGGIGKGHLVKEIDALGGVMGNVADHAGIHYRTLNKRKGPAVRGPRAQMDRDLYKSHMQEDVLQNYPNLSLFEASVEDFLLEETSKPGGFDEKKKTTTTTKGLLGSQTTEQQERLIQKVAQEIEEGHRKARIRGVVVDGTTDQDGTTSKRCELYAHSVVITTGTFLRGVLMLGHDRYAGGRHLRDSERVEPPSNGLSETLAKYEFPLSRLKTGTPARIDGRTINWDACRIQPTDNPVQAFSHLLQFREEQPPNIANNDVIDCYQTATNEETHKLVLEYEHTLPIYDGLDGTGNGPRYCPSIYKKVQRFPDRLGHNCFLEPEGLNTDIVYPNGMSGPYPEEIQQKILRSMRGLEQVEIVRPGYDVEYDFVNPISLTHTLETKKIGGLYLAGQICGTTGYEEAAAQGIVAGANAGRSAIRDGSSTLPFVIGRDEGYIGVLIDDLVTRGTSEPYRMFTSRAEYRITLRADNADLRLTRKGMDYGLVNDEERIAALETREVLVEDRIDKLQNFDMKVTEWAKRGGEDLMGGTQYLKKEGVKKSGEEILQMPHVMLKQVEDIIREVQNEEIASQSETEVMTPCPSSVYDTVEASIKYKSYVYRQHKDMESWRKAQGLRIPPDVVYDLQHLPTLSCEEVEKLNTVRPATFAEASQISGITPKSLIYLYHHVINRNRKRDRRSSIDVSSSRRRRQQQSADSR